MRWDEILTALESLSMSQGLYGRILRAINEMDDEDIEKLKDYMEAQSFRDTLDLVMFIEEGSL